MPTDVFGIPNVTLTDTIYMDSVPKTIVDTLWKLRGSPDAMPVAKKLALQGFIIDVPIMVWGWSAPLVMAMRIADGYKYVASGLMDFMPAPGQALPGAIKVSIDATDYPSLVVIPPPPDVTTMVGSFLWEDADGTKHFAPGPGAYDTKGIAVRNGQQFNQGGVIYTADVTDGSSMMGIIVVHFTSKG
jgi:hypothetical protein